MVKRKNLITIKDLNGEDVKIMTHTLYEEKVKSLTMVMFVRTNTHYFFLFVLKNLQEQKEPISNTIHKWQKEKPYGNKPV